MARQALSRSSSVALDIIRFAAAAVVLLSHFSHSNYETHSRDWTTAGNLAVSIFFVLSGFVIRFVSLSRESSFKEYAIDRSSRIYSVVAPALLLTFVLIALARAVNPTRYAMLADPGSHLSGLWIAVANLTFTSELWGYEIVPSGNGPFWSIAYEVIYYVLYGLIFYRVRLRWVWFALLLLLAGPTIAFNGLFWLLGCLTYDLFARYRDGERSVGISSLALCLLLAIFAVARHPIQHILRVTERDQRLAWSTQRVTSAFPAALHLTSSGVLPWLARLSISYILTSLFTAVFMLWLLLLLERHLPNAPARFAVSVRTVADSTFTLYLVHLPTLILIGTLIGHPVSSVGAKVAVPLSIVVLCLPLSRLFDVFKRQLRGALLARSKTRRIPDGSVANFRCSG